MLFAAALCWRDGAASDIDRGDDCDSDLQLSSFCGGALSAAIAVVVLVDAVVIIVFCYQ